MLGIPISGNLHILSWSDKGIFHIIALLDWKLSKGRDSATPQAEKDALNVDGDMGRQVSDTSQVTTASAGLRESVVTTDFLQCWLTC